MESRIRRGTCSQIEAPEEASLRAGKLWDAAQTGAAMRLARVLKIDTFSNHQNYGRSHLIDIYDSYPLDENRGLIPFLTCKSQN
jgi:hypothetical protein